MHRLWISLVLFALTACGSPAPSSTPSPEPAEELAPASPPAAAEEAGDVPRVVFLGDSLTAGYTLGEEQAFPHLVGELLADRGIEVDVVNAGVSGDTSAGGLRRLDWLLRQEPDLLVVELGANDGLRGLDPEQTEENLRQIIARAREAGSRVLLLGMKIPPSYGPEYTEAFEGVFPKLAEELEVPLMPFLLDGVAADPELNLPDGIHPNAEGHELLAEALLPYLEPLVRTADAAVAP